MSDDAAAGVPPPGPSPDPAPDNVKAAGAGKAGGAAGKAGDTGKASDSAKKTGESSTDAKDPHGDDRRAFDEAYQSGIFRTDGPMAFLRESKIKKQHIGHVVNIFGSGPQAFRRSGSVREDYLVRIRTRYVPVEDYELMYATLAERRLLILNGQAGTGRFSTALRLLDELAAGKVSRFDDGQDIGSLTAADFEKGRGYIIELADDEGSALTEAKLDKLRDLVDGKCYCVVITELYEVDQTSLGGYAVEYQAPDKDAVLRRHIAEEVRENAGDGMEERLNELAAAPRFKNALGPAPRPFETAEMARFLAEHGRGRMDLDEVETQANKLVQRQVLEWFASLSGMRPGEKRDNALRLAAFRVALAVLNYSPYNLVAQAGVGLAKAFLGSVDKAKSDSDGKPDAASDTKSEPSPEKSYAPLFADDQTRRLPACRAEIVDGWLSFGEVRLPVGLAKYRDDRFRVVLLSYVWQYHHNLRAAMVTWLQELSEDPRPTIWVRAAQAAGLFCSLDFHFTYTEMIGSAVDASEGCSPRWHWIRQRETSG